MKALILALTMFAALSAHAEIAFRCQGDPATQLLFSVKYDGQSRVIINFDNISSPDQNEQQIAGRQVTLTANNDAAPPFKKFGGVVYRIDQSPRDVNFKFQPHLLTHPASMPATLELATSPGGSTLKSYSLICR